jgi:hypothetical protein
MLKDRNPIVRPQPEKVAADRRRSPRFTQNCSTGGKAAGGSGRVIEKDWDNVLARVQP